MTKVLILRLIETMLSKDYYGMAYRFHCFLQTSV